MERGLSIGSPGHRRGPGFSCRHRSSLSSKPTGQDSETQGPPPTTTASRRQDQISTGFNCWNLESAASPTRPGKVGNFYGMCRATRGYNNRQRPKRRGRNQFHAARPLTAKVQGQRVEKKGRPAVFIKHPVFVVHAMDGRGTPACAGTNIVAFSPGPHLGSVAARWTCMVGGRLVCGRLWWCGVVSGPVVRQNLLPFFLSFSHHSHMDPFFRKERRRRSPPSWTRELGGTRPCALSKRIVAGLVDTPESPERLSSFGCPEASVTPVTDCLAPEHAPARP